MYIFCMLWYLILRPALHMLVFTTATLIFNDVYIHMHYISFILYYRIRITQHFVWFICNFMLHWNMHPENYSCCCESPFLKLVYVLQSTGDFGRTKIINSLSLRRVLIINDDASATHQIN
jgi:hypothetical protein